MQTMSDASVKNCNVRSNQHHYCGSRIIRTKIRENLCELSRMCELAIIKVSGEAYSCVNNNCANEAECANYSGVTLSGLYCNRLTSTIIGFV